MASKRIVRRAVLERSSRALLARFLRAHAAVFCDARGISIAAVESSAPRDRSLIDRLYTALHTHDPASPLPDETRRAFTRLDALATPAAGEALVRLDTEGVFPRSALGDEDLALTALLQQPELAEAVRVVADAESATSFTEYESEDGKPLAFGDKEKEALEATMGALLAQLDRTSLCTVHVTREPGKVSLEVVHARRPRTFDKVDPNALVVDASTDIHAERAFAEIALASGAVAIHAGVGVKRLLCESLGIVFASNPRYFGAARSYDLSPLADPTALLAIEGVPRLVRVEIHDVAVRTRKGSNVVFGRPRADLLADEDARGVLDAALAIGTPTAIKVYLTIRGRDRPLKVELSAKDGRNRVDFDRDDPEVVEVVRAYLRARGLVKAPAAQAAGTAE